MNFKQAYILPVFVVWALFLGLSSFGSDAQAQVTISDRQVSVTGVISAINIDSFTVQTGTSSFRINTDDLNIDDDLDTLISEGLEVIVVGDLEEDSFRGPTIEASQIRILGQYQPPKQDIIILDDGRLG